MKMESVRFSELSVNFYQTKLHHMSGGRTSHGRRCENVRSHVLLQNLHVEAKVNSSLYIKFESCEHFSNLHEICKAFLVCCPIQVSSYFSRIRGHSEWNFRRTTAYPFCLHMTVGARSKERIVFARSNAGIVVSNPSQGMGVCIVCVYSVFVLFCV
jgi:hypothetical protein